MEFHSSSPRSFRSQVFNRIEEKGEVIVLYFKILYLFYLKTALSDLVLLCMTRKKVSHYSQGLW